MKILVDDPTLAAAVRGEARALRALVEALQRPFYNLSLRMLSTHADAEDATQEALLRVITHLASFRGESRFSTWAWTLATRVILERRRGRARLPISIEDFEADLTADRDEGGTQSPENALMLAQVKLGCGRAMLLCLDVEQRIAYTLGEILELPGPEAAAVLGISAAAFRQRLSRARQRVQAHLKRCCGLVEPTAPCRCHKRLRPAQALDRLDPRDAESGLELGDLRARVAAIEELSRARVYYQADPQGDASPALLARVHASLGLD